MPRDERAPLQVVGFDVVEVGAKGSAVPDDHDRDAAPRQVLVNGGVGASRYTGK